MPSKIEFGYWLISPRNTLLYSLKELIMKVFF